jgi:transcriptional regulator GlxA family with amidase domain
MEPLCFFAFQCEYNAISYNDQMRLRTAVELLKATKDIESQLEKVSITCTYFSPT